MLDNSELELRLLEEGHALSSLQQSPPPAYGTVFPIYHGTVSGALDHLTPTPSVYIVTCLAIVGIGICNSLV